MIKMKPMTDNAINFQSHCFFPDARDGDAGAVGVGAVGVGDMSA